MYETTTLECNKHESQVDCNNICNSLDDYRKLASFSVSDLKSFVDTDDIWEFRVLNYSFEMEAVKSPYFSFTILSFRIDYSQLYRVIRYF